MSNGSDFFDDLRGLLFQHFGTGTAAALVEHELRERWGGTRLYVRQRDPEWVADRLAVEISHGAPRGSAFACVGVSRATGFRLMRRR